MFTLNIQVLVEEAEEGNRYTATISEMPGLHLESENFPAIFITLYASIVEWVRESKDVNERMNQLWLDIQNKAKAEEPVRSNVFGPLREEQ